MSHKEITPDRLVNATRQAIEHTLIVRGHWEGIDTSKGQFKSLRTHLNGSKKRKNTKKA